MCLHIILFVHSEEQSKIDLIYIGKMEKGERRKERNFQCMGPVGFVLLCLGQAAEQPAGSKDGRPRDLLISRAASQLFKETISVCCGLFGTPGVCR